MLIQTDDFTVDDHIRLHGLIQRFNEHLMKVRRVANRSELDRDYDPSTASRRGGNEESGHRIWYADVINNMKPTHHWHIEGERLVAERVDWDQYPDFALCGDELEIHIAQIILAVWDTTPDARVQHSEIHLKKVGDTTWELLASEVEMKHFVTWLWNDAPTLAESFTFPNEDIQHPFDERPADEVKFASRTDHIWRRESTDPADYNYGDQFEKGYSFNVNEINERFQDDSDDNVLRRLARHRQAAWRKTDEQEIWDSMR